LTGKNNGLALLCLNVKLKYNKEVKIIG
jgi:hypothetical protein